MNNFEISKYKYALYAKEFNRCFEEQERERQIADPETQELNAKIASLQERKKFINSEIKPREKTKTELTNQNEEMYRECKKIQDELEKPNSLKEDLENAKKIDSEKNKTLKKVQNELSALVAKNKQEYEKLSQDNRDACAKKQEELNKEHQRKVALHDKIVAAQKQLKEIKEIRNKEIDELREGLINRRYEAYQRADKVISIPWTNRDEGDRLQQVIDLFDIMVTDPKLSPKVALAQAEEKIK